MTDITANVVVSMPSQLFTMARSFKAVANGKIYIGKIDTDPVNPENQIQVYVENEDGAHVPVSQPIIINAAGYPVYNGQIAKFVTVQGHSMAVYDAYGAQQFNFPNVLKYDPDQLEKRLSGVDGFKLIGQVDSFDELRTIVPEVGGQRILLASYYSGGRTGGGEFIARSTVGMSNIPSDDGGVIATVNSSWYWERVDQDNATVEDFGAIPYVGDDSSDVVSSSTAFQNMFNSLNRIFSSDSRKNFVIDNPVLLKGSYFTINLSGGRLTKKTSTKTGLSDLIPVFGGFAPSDINCVFMAVETVRYFQIKNLDIWCNEAPSIDRPVGIYIPSATNYRIEGVNFRGCLYDLWFKNAWRGTLKDIRGNESISHSCFYDATRTNASGAAIADAQSATSVIFDGYYANSPGGSGIYLNRVDYSNIVMAAVDHAVGPAYTFIRSNVFGAMGAENATVEYLNIIGGVVDIYLSTYDSVTDNDHYIMEVSGSDGATVNLRGQFRTQKYRLANVQGADNVVVVEKSNYWNGSVKTAPQSVCAEGNFLDVHVGIGGAIRKYRDGVLQEVRESAPAYSTAPVGTGSPYYSPIFRVAMSSGGTSIQIPMYRIKEVFPNFNRKSNTLVEYLRIKVTNGSGVAAGASFFCANDSVVSYKLDGQFLVGNGSTDATVTGVTANSMNLTITFSGSIASGSVIELSYL
ncbi:phage head-binding domain-containing protein [Escherichia coli]|uniref:phage head-binding domain-containing protein n=1 Tax=Escherichia coli TaxID=562 RepID=UPI002FBE959D